MIGWNFPGNHGAQVKGVADAGIENFNGTELPSLVRENCQNSLDAASDETDPRVLVEFERYSVQNAQIPGIEEYRRILENCKSFWNTAKSEKTNKFLEKALSHANSDRGYMLRISDYNTTGLSDPYAYRDDKANFNFEGWNALVKIDGGANKGDDKAGSFGIGKSASFSNSHYRLVFYRTLNQQYERATQGISRLVSYREKGSAITNGVGYYGDKEGNHPVESISELEEMHHRSEIGTDIFIYGFNGKGDWDGEIIEALLENFLMSFYHGYLRARVQGHEINKDTLGGFILRVHGKSPGRNKGTYGNYLALTRTEGTYSYSRDFHGLGTLELRLLVDPNEKLDRQVLIVRKAGMKLFRLKNISRLVPFTGILELKGKELNRYFRDMETVAHDNWEPGRHDDPKQAMAYYNEIRQWIIDIVSQLGENVSDDEMDVEGLSGVLQKEPEHDVTGDSENSQENLNDYLGQINVIERIVNKPKKGFFYGQGDEGIGETEYTSGTLDSTGNPGLRILKGKRKRKKLDSHKGNPDPEGADLVIEKKTGTKTSCPLKNVRVIKRGSGIYTVNFFIPRDVEYGKVELVTVGENGKPNRPRIIGAKQIAGCSSAILNGDYIEAINLSSSEKIQLSVELADSRDYAMEVNVYEDH